MSEPVLIYDGDCPFCSNYVEFLRLRERFPKLTLVDARDAPDHPAIEAVTRRGLAIDEGMALVDGDAIYHGADAIHALAEHGPSTLLGQINDGIFRSKLRARLLYAVLRRARNLTLRVLGRDRLGF